MTCIRRFPWSMWKALQRTALDDEASYGFLRDDAVLAVVHLTDEIDCSYNTDWETIFLPEGDRVFWSDPDAAAPTSAVCWNAGVACTGAPGLYDDCVPSLATPATSDTSTSCSGSSCRLSSSIACKRSTCNHLCRRSAWALGDRWSGAACISGRLGGHRAPSRPA